jgi:hypothetical protein
MAHRSTTENFLSWLPVSFVSFVSVHSAFMAVVFNGLNVVFVSCFMMLFFIVIQQGKIDLLIVAEKD